MKFRHKWSEALEEAAKHTEAERVSYALAIGFVSDFIAFIDARKGLPAHYLEQFVFMSTAYYITSKVAAGLYARRMRAKPAQGSLAVPAESSESSSRV